MSKPSVVTLAVAGATSKTGATLSATVIVKILS